MKRIHLLRHGKTSLHGHYVGSTDIHLSEDGIAEIKAMKNYLHGISLDIIFCSPLIRCIETFHYTQLSQEMRIDSRLKEIDFGVWEAKTFEQIHSEHREAIQQWVANPLTFRFPEGESIADFNLRVDSFCDNLMAIEEQEILVICHGGVIRQMICHFLNLPYTYNLCFRVDTGKLAQINLQGNYGQLIALNIGGNNG